MIEPKEIQDFNRRMGIVAADPAGLTFIPLPDERVELTGFPWIAREHRFRRLPLQPEAALPPEVDRLADCTAGGKARFRSNSRRLLLKFRRGPFESCDNLSPMGAGAFDLYVGAPGREEFRKVVRAHPEQREVLSQLYASSDGAMRTFTLYFPSYRSVEAVEIGIEPDAVLEPPEPLNGKFNGIAVYGSSIAQGACASRPGLNYINRLSRRLGRHCVNLGFSGAGRGEPEVAAVIAEISGVELFVLDFEPNIAGKYAQKLPEFIRVLRRRHPDTPILAVSRYPFAELPVRPQDVAETRAVLARMQDPALYFADGSAVLGNDFGDCLADGIHATDEAFSRMCDFLAPVISNIFKHPGGGPR